MSQNICNALQLWVFSNSLPLKNFTSNLISIHHSLAETLQPKFTWLSDRSLNGIPLLSIRLQDRDDDDDVIILNRYNPIPVDLDEFRSEVDPCIFKGFLKSDPNSEVVLTGGCPGDHTFDVSKKVSIFKLYKVIIVKKRIKIVIEDYRLTWN